MPGHTIRLHRVFRAPPERVYRAFTNADAMAKWLPPNGFTGKVHQMEVREGGTHKMSFTNFTSGKSHSFGGRYLEVKPNDLPGEVHVTVTFRKVPTGTELNVVQEGVPEVIPADACYVGLQESLAQLGKLVEPEIAD